jgi:hypothetical protein
MGFISSFKERLEFTHVLSGGTRAASGLGCRVPWESTELTGRHLSVILYFQIRKEVQTGVCFGVVLRW